MTRAGRSAVAILNIAAYVCAISLAVLVWGRMARPDGVTNLSELTQAQAAALKAVIEKNYQASKSILVTEGGVQVPFIDVFEDALPGVQISSETRAQDVDGGRWFPDVQESDIGRVFDIILLDRPLVGVWTFTIDTGRCGHTVSVLKLPKSWKAISATGGCVR